MHRILNAGIWILGAIAKALQRQEGEEGRKKEKFREYREESEKKFPEVRFFEK